MSRYSHILNQRSTRKADLYFVAAPAVSRIKIGITDQFARRYRNLQLSSPVDLSVLLVVKATARQEKAVMLRFSSDRVHGEWFVASAALLSFVDDLRDLDDAARAALLRSMRGRGAHAPRVH